MDSAGRARFSPCLLPLMTTLFFFFTFNAKKRENKHLKIHFNGAYHSFLNIKRLWTRPFHVHAFSLSCTTLDGSFRYRRPNSVLGSSEEDVDMRRRLGFRNLTMEID